MPHGMYKDGIMLSLSSFIPFNTVVDADATTLAVFISRLQLACFPVRCGMKYKPPNP